MILTIDIGNTRVKATLFKNNTFVASHKWTEHDDANVRFLLQQYNITYCVFSNVGRDRPQLRTLLHDVFGKNILYITALTPSPLSNPYNSLGSDRYAACVGAWTLCPNHSLLVIDAGTCVTYDFISNEGVILGGNISPGILLRSRSMHEHTELLPLVTLKGETPFIGYDINTAIRSGVIMGLKFEIEGFMKTALKKNPNLNIFFTGGDAFELEEDLSSKVNIEPNLVSIGMKTMLDTYISQK